MNKKKAKGRRIFVLPPFLKTFFWDTPFERLSWSNHQDFIMQRILAEGNWRAVQWLRHRIGDEALRAWILQRHGRGLNKRQLRFWQLILPLPDRAVNAWLHAARNTPWEKRVAQ